MGIVIGLLLISGICFGLVYIFAESGYNKALEGKEKFIEKLKTVCERDNINFQMPQQVLGGHINEYSTEVTISFQDNSCITPAYYWIDSTQNKLCFVGLEKSFKISIDSIEMYTFDGDIKYTSTVKNNGKNVSVSGAIIGSVIAGAPGMIIGATKDRNNLTTEIEKKDDRKVYIYYRNQNNDIEMVIIQKTFFSEHFNFDNFIRQALPTKSDTYLLTQQNQKNNNFDENIESKLEKIKKLYEKGLINEDEYNQKRQELLNTIN